MSAIRIHVFSMSLSIVKLPSRSQSICMDRCSFLSSRTFSFLGLPLLSLPFVECWLLLKPIFLILQTVALGTLHFFP